MLTVVNQIYNRTMSCKENIYLADTCAFWGHWYHFFSLLMTSPLGFKSQSEVLPYFAIFAESNVMYLSQDSPLVLHLQKSWQPARSWSLPHMHVQRWDLGSDSIRAYRMNRITIRATNVQATRRLARKRLLQFRTRHPQSIIFINNLNALNIFILNGKKHLTRISLLSVICFIGHHPLFANHIKQGLMEDSECIWSITSSSKICLRHLLQNDATRSINMFASINKTSDWSPTSYRLFLSRTHLVIWIFPSEFCYSCDLSLNVL